MYYIHHFLSEQKPKSRVTNYPPAILPVSNMDDLLRAKAIYSVTLSPENVGLPHKSNDLPVATCHLLGDPLSHPFEEGDSKITIINIIANDLGERY